VRRAGCTRPDPIPKQVLQLPLVEAGDLHRQPGEAAVDLYRQVNQVQLVRCVEE
jgi:hypothetical protein